MPVALPEPAIAAYGAPEEPARPAEPQQPAPQQAWTAMPLRQRLAVLKRARHQLALRCDDLVSAIPPGLDRSRADSYAAEVLPLLASIQFLERDARRILAPRTLGGKGLPFWLGSISSSIERVPHGTVLIIAAANYPLFLAGVQAAQALAAGNAVVWKPGRNGRPVAEVFAQAFASAGLPDGVLRLTEDSVDAAIDAIDARPSLIVFTGSASAGRDVLSRAARHAIPVIAELSGCDAVVALDSADPVRLVEALAFGMRFNGSATCMAPRRLFLIGKGRHGRLLDLLQEKLAAMDGVELSSGVHRQLAAMVLDAEAHGATVHGTAGAELMKPLLVLNGSSAMQLAQADIFAPVLTVIEVDSPDEVAAQDRACPFGLTAAIFGEPSAAQALGRRLQVGTILINDLIVPTADPRVPFGGRRGSGFGVTRGAEGLLQMTVPRVISIRRDKSTRHFLETGPAHEELFRATVTMTHSATFGQRFLGVRQLIAAIRNLSKAS